MEFGHDSKVRQNFNNFEKNKRKYYVNKIKLTTLGERECDTIVIEIKCFIKFVRITVTNLIFTLFFLQLAMLKSFRFIIKFNFRFRFYEALGLGGKI